MIYYNLHIFQFAKFYAPVEYNLVALFNDNNNTNG